MKTNASRIFGTSVLVILILTTVACGQSIGGLPSDSATQSGPRPAAAFLTPQATPEPVTFPADDGPHNDLTEWWYFTGHLTTASGEDYGFEFVIFQGNRFGFPPTYAAHFAVTDLTNGTFHYDQKTQSAGQPGSTGTIDLKVGDWTLSGSGPEETINASMPGYALTLNLESQKPPALHDGDGYFEWAPATGSYYYSRTRMSATGRLTANGAGTTVSGQAWMDHQWGNFLLFGGGGWDWYSIQLSNGVDLMLWHSRDSHNKITFGSGTYVDQSGLTTQLGFDDFTITPTSSWTSPHSGATYPSGWKIGIPSRQVSLTLEPLLKDQELDTRPSTGVIYWEGDVKVSGSEKGQSVTGEAYVELTGYAPAAPAP